MTELLTDEGLAFVTDRHLATLSTMHPDGRIHVVPVGFTYVDGVARIITSGDSRKVGNILSDPRVSIAQIDGARWLTLQGVATVATDAATVRLGEDLYSRRYRVPRENPARVVIEVTVTSVLGSAGLRA